MRYEEPVFRPPSEASSLIIQATIGCSHNKCTFCGMYKGKRYRERSVDEIKEDLLMAKDFYGDVKRLFLADGNALAMDTSKLLEIIEFANNLFNLERISMYATPQDLLKKDEEELKMLKDAGLKLLYVGIESGDDEILKEVRKGVTSKQIVEGCRKAIKCGIEIDTKWGGAKTFFSGEGLFLLKLEGNGDVFLSSFGGVEKIELKNESLIVDTGHIVAFDDNLEFKVKKVGGLKSTILSGEGLVAEFTGEGNVWIQTRSISSYIGWLSSLIPKRD